MKEDKFTDITFELFNYCTGSCPGCMLSTLQRKDVEMAQSLENVILGLEKIADYGRKNSIAYRPVFSFGDTFKLSEEKIFRILDKTIELNMAFGVTVTGVDSDFEDGYRAIAKKIINQYKNTVFDITIDPFRLINPTLSQQYIRNLKAIIENSQHLHLQVLASSALISKFSPEKLLQTLELVTKDYAVFLAFSPTVENLDSKAFNYNISDAYNYAQAFYNLNAMQRQLRDNEISRFRNNGHFSDFSKIVFHVGSDLNIYPVNYSIYGDIIRDDRNRLAPIGNLIESNLDEILNPRVLKKLDIKNSVLMSTSEFDCETCQWFESCSYSGVGLIRSIYKNYESRAGHCYGPGRNQEVLS